MASLRDNFGVKTSTGQAAALQEQDIANGMGSLRKGWASGRIGNDINALAADEASMRADGQTAEADAARAQIGALTQRQGMYAPETGRVEDINSIGSAAGWLGGQVGQGAASMIDPMAVGTAIGGAATAASFIPRIGRPLSTGLRALAPAAMYGMNQRQLKGEAYNEMAGDPTVMANHTAAQLNDRANLYGASAAVLDTAVPGLMAHKLAGGGLRKGLHSLHPMGLAAAEMAGEGLTETGQEFGKQALMGDLNPNRDTRGDNSALLNSFAGGAAGAGPFAIASSAADAGYRRVGNTADVLGTKAGEAFDLANNSEVMDKVREVGGKIKGGVTDLLANKDGDVSAAALLDNLKTSTQELKSRGQASLDEHSILAAEPPMDIVEDPDKLTAWFVENDGKRAQLVATKLSEMTGDEEAQAHFEALSSEDPEAQAQAVDAAAAFVLERTPMGRASSRADSLGASLGAMAAVAGPAIGRGVVATGKALGKFGKSVLDGATGEAKRNNQTNEQAAPEPFQAWRDRVYGVDGTAAAAKVLDEAATEANQRAELAGDYAADISKRLTPKAPNMALLARNAAYVMSDVVMSTNAKGMGAQNVRLNRLVDDLHGAFKTEAPEVLQQLGSIMGAKAGPVVEYMTNELAARSEPRGRQTVAATRDVLARQVVGLVDPLSQRRLMEQGINLNTPRGREQALGLMEDYADGIGSAPYMRKTLDKVFGADSVRDILTVLNGKEEKQADTMVDDRNQTVASDEEAVDDGSDLNSYDEAAAEKTTTKGSGPKVYGYHATVNLRTNSENSDPFTLTKKTEVGEAATRPKLFIKGQKLSPQALAEATKGMNPEERAAWMKNPENTSAAAKKIADMRKQLLEDPDYPDHDNHDVREVSALKVMKDLNMQPTKILQLHRDYLAMDGNTEDAAKIASLLQKVVKITKGSDDRFAEDRAFAKSWRAANPKKPISELTAILAKKKMAEIDGPLSEATKAAEDYFDAYTIVVGEQLSDRDSGKMTITELLDLGREGERALDATRLVGSKTGESTSQAVSDANLLIFKTTAKKSGEIAIPAGKLVNWVRKQRGKTEANSSEDTKGDHSNRSKDEQYLDAVSEGIAVLVGSGLVKGMPYKMNPDGKAEQFNEQGIPESLRLATMTYGAMKFGEKSRRGSGPERRVPISGPPNKFSSTPETDARLEDDQQAKVAKDQNTFENRDTEGSIDDVADESTMKSRIIHNALTNKEKAALAKITDPTERDAYIASLTVGMSAEEEAEFMVDLALTGTAGAAFNGDARGVTDSVSASPLDFTKGQDKGAVPDEYANQRWLSRQTDADVSVDKSIGPEPKGTAASRAQFRGAQIAETYNRDVEAGQAQIKMRIRMALRPEYVKGPEYVPGEGRKLTMPGMPGKDQVVGGVHYIAPVAWLANPVNLAATGVDMAAPTIQAIQAKVANILLMGDVSKVEQVKIARLMLDGVTAMNVRTKLQRIADGVSQGKPLVAKQETAPAPKPAPAPNPAPKVSVMETAIAKRQKYLDNPPDDYTSAESQAVLTWTKTQLARVLEQQEKEKGPKGDPDRQDQLSDYKFALMRLQKKAESMVEGDRDGDAADKRNGTNLFGNNPDSALEVANAGLPKGQQTRLGASDVNVADHQSSGYRERTKYNADSAGATVAIATDFTTAGERLTKSVAGDKYFAIDYGTDTDKAGLRLAKFMRGKDTTTLNVAGNGIYTLFQQQGLEQEAVNAYIHSVIAAAHALHPITKIVSGGQTGVDIAGAVAASALGIPAVITLPRGYVQRNKHMQDQQVGKAAVEKQIVEGAAALPKGQQTQSGGVRLDATSGRKLNAQEGLGASSAKSRQDGNARVATQAEMDVAKAYALKVLGPQITVDFKNITGYSGEFIDARNVIEISTTAAAGTMGTLYHEAMHVFFRDFVKGNPKVQAVFESLINDPKHLAKLTALLDGYPAAQAQLTSGEERLAYTYQFWKAGLLQVDTKANTWLQKIGKFFRRVAGRVRDSEKALELFQAFDNGKMSEPSAAGRVIAAAMGKGSNAMVIRRKMDGVVQGLAALTMPAAEILGNSVSPTARKLGTMMFTNPGDEAHGAKDTGMMNARRNASQQYINTVNHKFENMSETDQATVQKLLQSEAELGDIPNAEHREAVKHVRNVLDRFHTYLTESGLSVGKIEKYYPTVWSAGALNAKKDEFINMLVTKYAKELAPATGTVEDAAQRVWQSLVNKEGVDAHLPAEREDGVLNPFFASQEQRTLPWLKGEDKEMFLEKNMPLTLTRYFNQGAHAAEYRRRFGENGEKLDAMLLGSKVWNPVTRADDRASNGIVHELERAAVEMEKRGELKDADGRKKWVTRQMRDITQSVAAMEGSLGKDISPNMRKFNSWMTVYQNVRLLPMALFSSFVDPLALVARGAPMEAAYETFMYGMREVFRGWGDAFRDMPAERQKDEWRLLAEHIGSSEIAMFSHHVSEEYSSAYMTSGAKKINDKMFVLNGMEAWNRGSRVMATKWAVRFLEKHVKEPDANHSARWLKELGLTPSMINLDADGNLITNRHVLVAMKGISLEQASREIAPIHDALNRWVEGAVITPNAAQRPAWSSDPNYASMFHLKQFSYSFHQTILKRAVNEFKNGNMSPIGALAAFIPTMITADIMKGLIQGGGSLPPYMAGMNAGDWFMHGTQRAGLSGIGVIGMDAMADPASLGGPAFEQVVDAIRDEGSKTMLKAMPLNSLYGQLFRGAPTPV